MQPSSSLILAMPPSYYYRSQGKAWAIDPQAEVESGMFFCQQILLTCTCPEYMSFDMCLDSGVGPCSSVIQPKRPTLPGRWISSLWPHPEGFPFGEIHCEPVSRLKRGGIWTLVLGPWSLHVMPDLTPVLVLPALCTQHGALSPSEKRKASCCWSC